MVTHRQRVREIERCLAGRRLVYFGTRGTDARPLLELRNFEEVFSQIAPLEAGSIAETCLETLKSERVDLDLYSIDQDPSEAVREIRRGLLRAFSRPAVVVPYRPSAVLASACFTRQNLVQYLGVFHEKQACFEHKPWVESELSAAGIRAIPWTYFADDDMALVREAAEAGPLVLRTNRSDGGSGLTLVEDPSLLPERWPVHPEGFLAAAPLLSPSIPLNVNACVFSGGEVSLHAPSVQLIGLSNCTHRRFGYCGNDFARIAELDSALLDDLEMTVTQVGRWMARNGYLGAFGVDAIVYRGIVYLVEINARFQGSSHLAASLARKLDRPDIFLDHIAAHLGLPPPSQMPLAEMALRQTPASHVVCHYLGEEPLVVPEVVPDRWPIRCIQVPRRGVRVLPGAVLFDAIFSHAVTREGSDLLDREAAQVNAVARQIDSMPLPSGAGS